MLGDRRSLETLSVPHSPSNLTFLIASATMSLSFEVLPSANAGVTQLVECDLAKVDVAGSNPVSRSNFR